MPIDEFLGPDNENNNQFAAVAGNEVKLMSYWPCARIKSPAARAKNGEIWTFLSFGDESGASDAQWDAKIKPIKMRIRNTLA